MDLWDVVRLMLRRWFVAVPMLLLTVFATTWVAMTVRPDYTSVGNVSLVPPSVEESTPAGQARTVNPWDTGSLTGAVVIRLRSKAMHDTVAAQGYAGQFEADRDLVYPTVITIKVTAPSGPEAQSTVRRLLGVVSEEVARQQAQYRLKPGQEITSIVVDDGSNVEPATGKIKRALVVVFGIGILLTVAVTVCVDALLRWLARRRSQAADRLANGARTLATVFQAKAAPAATANGGPVVTDETTPISVSIRYRPGPADVPVSPPPAGTGTPVRPAAAPAPGPGAWSAPPRRVPAESDITEPILDTRLEPATDDATIILPLSNAPWATTRTSPNSDHAT